MLLKGLLRQVVNPKTADDRGIKEEAALGAIDALDENLLAKKLQELLTDKRYILELLVLLLLFTSQPIKPCYSMYGLQFYVM